MMVGRMCLLADGSSGFPDACGASVLHCIEMVDFTVLSVGALSVSCGLDRSP